MAGAGWAVLPCLSGLCFVVRLVCKIIFRVYIIIFLELFPAIRSNLLCRTTAQKDFHCTRAKRTGEAIGARAVAVIYLSILKEVFLRSPAIRYFFGYINFYYCSLGYLCQEVWRSQV